MADVKIRLTADLDDALREVSGFRKEYAELVRQVAQPLKRLNDFTALESTLEDTQRQARSAREQIRTLGNELASTIRPSRELQQAYRDSISDLRSLERAETVQVAKLGAMRRELKQAGLDTRSLTSERQRLQRELDRNLRLAGMMRPPPASGNRPQRSSRARSSSAATTWSKRVAPWE
ncbi:hypothetical protein P4132_03640 [Pseudomonas aeruginosa]|nr:hypothetical protein [Pseudomonas aeruginosa]